MIRPERIGIEAHGSAGDNRLPGLVERAVFLGSAFELHVRVLGGDVLKAMISNDGAVTGVRGGSSRDAPPAADGLRVLALRSCRAHEAPRAS